MRIIRVFPSRTSFTPTDVMSFVGEPPKRGIPAADAVHVSVTFTWDLAEAKRLMDEWQSRVCVPVLIGGPACGDKGVGFTAAQYVKPGVTFTSRGCPNACAFCFVPKREGNLRELPVVPGWLVQDNNLTACSSRHLDSVFAMLADQPHPIRFVGGLEAARITPAWIDRMRSIPFGHGELFLAYDRSSVLPALKRAATLLRNTFRRDKCYCYVLIGYPGDTLEAARFRCEEVWELGLFPWAMLFRDETGMRPDGGWRQLQRTFCRPAGTRAYFNTYNEFSNHAVVSEDL